MAPDEAFSVLRRFLADPRHGFIADDLSCEDRIVRTELMAGAIRLPTIILSLLRVDTVLRWQRSMNHWPLHSPVSRIWYDWCTKTRLRPAYFLCISVARMIANQR